MAQRLLLCLLLIISVLPAQMNNPYPSSEADKNIYYSSFSERPKHLDPATAYSADEYRFICQIYEPVVQYHYLKRPYELIPLTAARMPEFAYYNKDGKKLPSNAPAERVDTTVWTITIQPGIMFQEHPCFAKEASGDYVYHQATEKDLKGIDDLFDFPQTGTRELKAADYVYQLKRLADPRNRCPIFGVVVAEYIVGMKDFAGSVNAAIESERQKRREAGGVFYNRESDEKENPIILDYSSMKCEGLRIIDDYTYEIILNRKYPQFIYWLAMPFFSPMPEEAIRFYSQGPMTDRNIILDWFPVGTGAYRLDKYNPHWRVELVRNENYREELYPSEGEAGDPAAGLLADAGQPMPRIERAVYSKEKESTPIWLKYLQGYYDISGISSENFSNVMNLETADATLSEEMQERGIRLVTSVDTTIIYMGFNMGDPVIGGLDEKRCKLRQAFSIALNREEYIQIFRNGRGITGMGPIPPGIFGFREGQAGLNPYTHTWDAETKSYNRLPMERARKLLAEAGYPEGIGPDGERLVVFYDTVASPGNADYLAWLKKQFNKIGVNLEIRATDYNRFREKMNTGNYQIFMWGWNADYPDPENFLFLLYGPNSKVKFHGENAANYANPEFDKLYDTMNAMGNSPERQEIIDRMVELLRHDAPWEFGFYPKSYALYHSWVTNVKPNKMANNTLKYMNIDREKREVYRRTWNKPKLWIVALVLLVLAAIIGPGIYRVVRKEIS